MLDNEKIEEYSKLLKEVDAAKQTVQQLNTELTMLKNQGIEKLKEKGYKSLADAAKIEAQGEAGYMQILASAYNDPEKADFYSFLRGLDALKVSLSGTNKTIILDRNSEIVRMLYGAE